ncbi:MAG TPA: NADH-quinone oxidoreductase subunit C/D, partial [Armatimonadota bacterium]|nr:NADH-quinone oxidoreductase subunit C/D [Armatimonadota bacterium]
MSESNGILQQLRERFGEGIAEDACARDGVPTCWVGAGDVASVLAYLQDDVDEPYVMLHDLWAIDERVRQHRETQPPADFTVVYDLSSPDRESDVRLKVPLLGENPSLPTVTDLWPCADWYEREAWDMFGIGFDGHARMRRILMPPWWEGHPLRKEHPARATEMEPFEMPDDVQAEMMESMRFQPDEWGLEEHGEDFDYLFLNFGPHHPSTHGVLRVVLQLDGEEIVNSVPDIGFHHRGAEKMGERQSWHTYIPYTDRVDYLGGVMNNLPYVMAVESLGGIDVPDRAQVIRIMLAELFRISSHLVFLGTFAQDLGMMSPVFFAFNDRERVLDVIETITGARMHPAWFRIGGVAQDLPNGWEELIGDVLKVLPGKVREYEEMLLGNKIFRVRTRGIGCMGAADGLAWGATGPMLRASGVNWDLRKQRPYGGYEHFEFDVPIGETGDCYDRAAVHLEEIRQSVRIVEQCVANMPPGRYKSDHLLSTPPTRPETLEDIETLITHFVNVSWGPVIPAGEAGCCVEATKGQNRYTLISDEDVVPYRVR